MTSGPLLDQLAPLVCNRCAAKGGWHLTASPKARLNSMVAVAVCRSCGERIFLKELLPSGSAAAIGEATRVLTFSRELAETFRADGAVGLAEPIARLGSVLVFEFVEGEPADLALQSRSLEAKRDLMKRIGRWFAEFHRAGGASQGGVDFGDKLESLRIRGRVAGVGTARLEQAIWRLESALPTFAEKQLRHVHLHGDAKPGNFLLRGEQIVGFDIAGQFSNLAEYDLAQFHVQSAVVLARVRGCAEEPVAGDLDRAFLDGYSGSQHVDYRALTWLRGYFWLSFWLTARERGLVHRLRWEHFFRARSDRYLRAFPTA